MYFYDSILLELLAKLNQNLPQIYDEFDPVKNLITIKRDHKK